ncbi:high affinity zinc ion transporter [Teratosphaeria nubilosa]|uniref:High affinity zinc ion transporter n=1 Tax=Teratosphaeria nubilosa TaxID=161662 RepID=A0A6G1LL01_9PEZI|nr:high affinity zinc ion transporter [Teratosphaeria nubilosa]
MVRDIVCYVEASTADYSGPIGVRISAIFVVMFVSSAVTFFPVLATRVPKLKIPLTVYLFARYFGAGVITATAFIHLLDPAYAEIGPNTCVGMTGGWASYSWPPVIAMTSCLFVFLMDFGAERYVEKKYGYSHGTSETQDAVAMRHGSVDAAMMRNSLSHRPSHVVDAPHHGDLHQHSGDGEDLQIAPDAHVGEEKKDLEQSGESISISIEKEEALDRSFRQQIAAFLILEFGVIFHSVIIGLTLGSASGDDFKVLYPVIVFHQSFEGLGIGARLSAIPFPRRLKSMPWFLCAAYGLTTPIAIAAGIGVKSTYNPGSFTANVVAGLLDSISAGILLYTGLVELIARDFLFNSDRTHNDKLLTFMICSLLLGAAIMALLGKWA